MCAVCTYILISSFKKQSISTSLLGMVLLRSQEFPQSPHREGEPRWIKCAATLDILAHYPLGI
jgi:hypothetical protein